MATATQTATDRPAPVRAKTAFSWSSPLIYVIAYMIVVMSVVPVLYVWLNGFRTNS